MALFGTGSNLSYYSQAVTGSSIFWRAPARLPNCSTTSLSPVLNLTLLHDPSSRL
jgi:hypothetical protein